MARYKHYDYSQTKLLPVSYVQQILPGTFEYTLHYLIEEKIDLSVFDDRYQNDAKLSRTQHREAAALRTIECQSENTAGKGSMNIQLASRSLKPARVTSATSIESGDGISPIRQRVFLQSRWHHYYRPNLWRI